MTSKNLKINFGKATTDSNEIAIFLNGSLDDYNYKGFLNRVNKLIKETPRDLIFDCSNLRYISAYGLGAFVEILRSVNEYNGRLVLTSLQPQVREVFNMLGISSFIQNVNEMKETAVL